MNFIKNFITGLSAPISALKLITFSPKLLTLSLIPCLLTFIVLGAALYFSITGSFDALTLWVGTWVGGALTAALGLLLIYASFQTMVFILSLLALPFSDALSQATEKECGIIPPPTTGVMHATRLMLIDFSKTVVFLIVSLLFWIGAWIPVIGVAFWIGIALLNTLNFVTFSQTRREIGVRGTLTWLRNNFALSLGFGLITTLCFAIPVLNFFALPLSVVGGTQLYLKTLNT